MQRAHELIGHAAHDLRNPISVMTGAVHLLQRRWHDLTEDQRTALIDDLASHTNRLRERAENLLDWALVESTELTPAVQELDLHALAGDAAGDVRARAVRVVGSRVRALGDPRYARQLVRTLLVNAIRHGRPPITVETRECDGAAVIRILDQGPGVPDSIADGLFQPFVRGDASREGAGLGLAIARRLAEAQGGRLWYERTGSRTCFGVALPTAVRVRAAG